MLDLRLSATVEHSPVTVEHCIHQLECHFKLVGGVTFGPTSAGLIQPAKQQCGCHGLKRRHSDLFPPTRNINREASCYTTEQYGHRQGNRRGCPRAAILPSCLTQNCEHVAKEDRMCTAPSCAKECTRDFTIGNCQVRTQFKTLKLNCRGSYTF